MRDVQLVSQGNRMLSKRADEDGCWFFISHPIGKMLIFNISAESHIAILGDTCLQKDTLKVHQSYLLKEWFDQNNIAKGGLVSQWKCSQ